MRKPDLFIVGASKSGTTTLYRFLKQHPDIFMSELKEPRFFCKDRITESEKFRRENRKNLIKKWNFYPILTEKDYLDLFTGWENEKITGEASPQYLNSKVAAKEIRKFNPNAKIIIMLRNPVDWMYASHSQALKSGFETVSNFKKALELEEERKKGNLPKLSLLVHPMRLLYFEGAKFAEQVKRYMDVFDRKQIKMIIFDDFRKDNAKVYREVLKFL